LMNQSSEPKNKATFWECTGCGNVDTQALKQEFSQLLGPVENACIELLKPLNLEVIVLQC
jgi:hypothetical protein